MKVYITTNGHPNLRGHIIRQLISQQQIHLLNYGRADTWFFSSDNFNITTMNNTTKQYGPYTLHFTLHENDRIDGTLRWVPPSLRNEILLKALRIISKKEPTIEAVPFTNNRRFTIYTDTPNSIPHYIKINFKNKSTNILIAITGRLQACQRCASTKHWSNQCHVPDPDATQLEISTTHSAGKATATT